MLETRKVFISYSHTSTEYQEKVIQLVQDLARKGVECIADFNDCHFGEDLFHFMERIARDNSIHKVLCVIDQRYTENFNLRKGGVGSEAILITPLLAHERDTQGKSGQEEVTFKSKNIIPVIFDVDSNLQPVPVPSALESLYRVDLSTARNYAQNLDRLKNAIFDLPLVPKPEVIPTEVSSQRSSGNWCGSLPTAFCIHVDNNKVSLARGTLEDLHDQYLEHFSKQSTDISDRSDIDEKLREHTNSRNVLVDAWAYALRYNPEVLEASMLRRLFEGLMTHYWTQRPHLNNDWCRVPMEIATNDLFLHLIALLLKRDRYPTVTEILNLTFSFPRSHQRVIGGYEVLQPPGHALQYPLFRDCYHTICKPNQVTLTQLQDADLLLGTRFFLHHFDHPHHPEFQWKPYLANMKVNSWDRDAQLDGSLFVLKRKPHELEQLSQLLGFTDHASLKETYNIWDSKPAPYRENWLLLTQFHQTLRTEKERS